MLSLIVRNLLFFGGPSEDLGGSVRGSSDTFFAKEPNGLWPPSEGSQVQGWDIDMLRGAMDSFT